MKYNNNRGFRKADKIVIVDKKNLASLSDGLIRIGAWQFEKRLVFMNNDGSSSERPLSEMSMVISKKDSAIWLRPDEVRMLKLMLDEITEKCLDKIALDCEVTA